MNPKQKAIVLVERFSKFSFKGNIINFPNSIAKTCAIFSVEQILGFNVFWVSTELVKESPETYTEEDTFEFWEAVLEELNKLESSVIKSCDMLYSLMGEFSVKVFDFAGPVQHLCKLKYEADEAIAQPDDIMEYSDCLLALFAAAYKAGFTYEQLVENAFKKLEIVKDREWALLLDGTYQHIEK